MTFVHFKLAFNGKVHRFASPVREDEIFQDVKRRVAEIVKEDSFNIFWNDGDGDVQLETSSDLLAAIDYAKVKEQGTNKPPCVHLMVDMTLTAGSEVAEKVEQEMLREEAPASEPATDAAASPPADIDHDALNRMNNITAAMSSMQIRTAEDIEMRNSLATELEALQCASSPETLERYAEMCNERAEIYIESLMRKREEERQEAKTELAKRRSAMMATLDTDRRMEISSMAIECYPGSTKTYFTLHFNCPEDFETWMKFLTCFHRVEYSVSCHPESRITIQSYSYNAAMDLLKDLRPLARLTQFQHVYIDEEPEIIRAASNFLEYATVKEVTIRQKSRAMEERFAAWLDFVRTVNPSKVRIERLEPTKTLVDFLFKMADLTESMWIEESLLSMEPLPTTVIQEILSRTCKYLHIRDESTKISLGQMENMARYFRNWGLKVSLVMPTSVFHVDAQIEEYSVKSGDGKKFQKGLVVIEHIDIDPKAEHN